MPPRICLYADAQVFPGARGQPRGEEARMRFHGCDPEGFPRGATRSLPGKAESTPISLGLQKEQAAHQQRHALCRPREHTARLGQASPPGLVSSPSPSSCLGQGGGPTPQHSFLPHWGESGAHRPEVRLLYRTGHSHG